MSDSSFLKPLIRQDQELPEDSLYYRFNTAIQAWQVLAVMLFFQLVWVAAIWATGAAANASKLPLLGLYVLVIGTVVIIIPDIYFLRTAKWVRQRWQLMLILFTLLIFGIGIIYAIYQRSWTYDEQYSFESAKIVATQGTASFFNQYANIEWLGPQHPPLIPLINGLALRIFGPYLLVLRLVSLVFGFGIILLTYCIGRELYNKTVGFVATVLLLSFPLIFRLGTSALTDVQLTFFFCLSLLLIIILSRKASMSLAIAIGFVIGVGLLAKYTMVFIFPVIFCYVVLTGNFRRLFPYLFVSGLVAGTMLFVWLLFAYEAGILTTQQENIANVNPGWFVTDSTGLKWLSNSLLTKLPSAFGAYNIPLLTLGLALVLWRRQATDLFLLAWILGITVILVLTIPDHRYFMPTFPAMATMMAIWLAAAKPEISTRAIVASLLFAAGALWLFIDWYRAAELFIN
ncbi:MAG: phospholipid carrier-dependent glycosyltransferase [Chloroflexi bacterium]|nr:phospholipid carrier-dependent glycosyltransferase [Chloroflexota bacterium]